MLFFQAPLQRTLVTSLQWSTCKPKITQCFQKSSLPNTFWGDVWTPPTTPTHQVIGRILEDYRVIYIYISTIPQLFLQLTSTSSDISPMSSNPEAPRSLAEIGIAYEYATWPPPKGGRQHVAQGEPWSGGRWAPKMILINGVKWVISPYKWPEINLWLIDNWDETKTWHLIP